MRRKKASPANKDTGRGIGELPCDEELLRLSKLALDVSADSCMWADREGHILYVNETACRALGYTKNELLSMKVPDFDACYDKRRYSLWWDEIKRSGSVKIESVHVRKDGSRFPVQMTVNYLKSGEKEYAFNFIRDITERKRAEEELRVAKQQAELYLDLLSHDINNMHQIALGYMEMARDMTPEAGQSEFLDKPIEVLQRSARLIKNVRKLQKLKEGMFRTESVDVCKLLVDVQGEFGAVPHKAITLNLNECEHCHVLANELLHDVFANLVSNAIKHTGDRADIVIDLNIVKDNEGRHCRVSVEDNGPGIPDDSKDMIFNRMIRGTTRAKGMGLGLYLVKSLVDCYGGRVWVEDRVHGDHSKGARFVVMLPVVDK